MALNSLQRLKHFVKNSSISYVVIITLIFGIGTIISIINWRSTELRANSALIAKYNQELNQSKSIITQKLNQYSLLLDDGSGLLAVGNYNVSQSQWLKFFQSYDLVNNYPGVDAVSFSQYVTASQLAGYLSNQSAQGQPNLTVTPSGSRSAYAPVTYVGYVSLTSLQALGYDQLSNPARKAAITQALSSGNVTMSGVVNLVAVHKGEPAFLIYKPIYSGSANTLAERQASIFGFAFIAINSQSFFDALLSRYLVGPGIAIQIYGGNISKNNLLYETHDYVTSVKHIASPLNSLVHLTFGGQTWDIKVITAKSIIQAGMNQSSLLDLITGIGVSALAAGVLWYFTYYRERKIYWQKQLEVQAAKDELLALASHQLRTPATIVKQYLGILLQNYGGSVTEQQRKILQTAYDSNEHQLDIANQFLDAARLGSGRIRLHIEDIVLNDVILQVVSDQQKIANERQQKISFKNPKRLYKVKGDAKYLPMVFENLISNAIKYSKRRTKITVSIHRTASSVYVVISDQGVGIADDDLPTLFEKFSRAANEQNGDGNGTGIGLYLVQQVVEMHHGAVSVESTLGKGSKFTVQLPIKSD